MGAPRQRAHRPAGAFGPRQVKRFAAAAAAAVLAFAAHAADPVAFVADLAGNATIEGEGKLTFLAELKPGTRLMLGSGATVAITYASSGAEYTVRGPGEFVVGASEVKAEKGGPPTKRIVTSVQDKATISRASQTATASLRMRSLPVEKPKRALEFPVDTRVATLEPVLLFHGEVPAGSEVTITDANGKAVWKAQAGAGTLKTGVKLSPATRYRWTVMTKKGALGEAQFETADAEAIRKVAQSKSAARSFSGRVMHALLLQEIGATQEAHEAWAALARERPDLPELSGLAR